MTDTAPGLSLRIGLTGGIASGKTTVANMFADLGIDLVDTDIIAREVVEPGQPAYAEVRDRFGDRVIDRAGELDRRALRAVVFADANKRRQLEVILHPRIRAEAARRSAAATSPYHLVIVPLMVESPMRDEMARVLVVDCSEATQLQRLLARDLESEDQARRMLAAQASREQRLAIADDVVTNDGALEDTREQVDRLHAQYLSLSSDSAIP